MQGDTMMSDVKKKIKIKAPLEKVWLALSDVESIGAWMLDDKVRVDLRVTGKYVFFNGDTTGKFTLIQAPRHLAYTWRQASWKKSWADSLVTWTLRRAGDETVVSLEHSRFPNEEERKGHQ